MITANTFTMNWYRKTKEKYRFFDGNLFEKVIQAFYLLEKLGEKDNLTFIFKGGTCLLLLLQEIKRFSIDIDIIVDSTITKDSLFKVLNEIIETSNFTHYEEQIRQPSCIPKAHFKFFYISPFTQKNNFVLLDVLFEKNPYNKIEKRGIFCPLIETVPPIIMVQVPSIENILGDKLTAFAPNTTGIPYNKDKEMEIIKQLFDIETLFDKVTILENVKTTFIHCAKQELNYRQMNNLTPIDVLDDIFKTAITIGGRGTINRPDFLLLEDGIRRIRTHIIEKNYILEEAILSAAKTAYLVALIKCNKTVIEHFDITKSLPKEQRTTLFKGMNKIKKFNPEAYYYFAKTQEILAE
jgi:Uncharacterized conserved protein